MYGSQRRLFASEFIIEVEFGGRYALMEHIVKTCVLEETKGPPIRRTSVALFNGI